MEVAKFRSHFFILFEHASLQYQRAQRYLLNLGRDIGRKHLSGLRTGSAALTAITNKGIAKLRPSISALIAAETIAQRARRNFVNSGVVGIYKARQLGAAVRAREFYLPELQRCGVAAIAAASTGIAKSRSYVAGSSERASAHLQAARQALANDKQKLEDVLAAKKAAIQAGCAVANSAAYSGIKKVRSQLYVPIEHCARYVQRAGDKVSSVGTEIMDKSRRIREARHTRENELRNLLATSADAVVVTDNEHRFVAANTNALELFGVSDANVRNFTLDSFVSKRRISDFNGHGASFGSGGVEKGRCEIRRLNGNLRLADYEFRANHLPFRHLCIFRNVTCKTIRAMARTETSGREATKRVELKQTNPIPIGERLLTLKEAAGVLRLSPRTVREYVKRGQIKGRLIGDRWRFRRADLDSFFESAPSEGDFAANDNHPE